MASLGALGPYRENAVAVPAAPRAIGPIARYLLTGRRGIDGRHVFLLSMVFAGIPIAMVLAILHHASAPVWFVVVLVALLIVGRYGVVALREGFARARRLRVYRTGKPTWRRVVGPVKRVTTSAQTPTRYFRLAWTIRIAGETYRGQLDHVNRRALQYLGEGSLIAVLYDGANPAVNTLWIDEERMGRENALALRNVATKRRTTQRVQEILLGASRHDLGFGGVFLFGGALAFGAGLVSPPTGGGIGFTSFISLVMMISGGVTFGKAMIEYVGTSRAYTRGEFAEGRIILCDEEKRSNIGSFVCIRWVYEVEGVTYCRTQALADTKLAEWSSPKKRVPILYDPDNPVVSTLYVE